MCNIVSLEIFCIVWFVIIVYNIVSLQIFTKNKFYIIINDVKCKKLQKIQKIINDVKTQPKIWWELDHCEINDAIYSKSNYIIFKKWSKLDSFWPFLFWYLGVGSILWMPMNPSCDPLAPNRKVWSKCLTGWILFVARLRCHRCLLDGFTFSLDTLFVLWKSISGSIHVILVFKPASAFLHQMM